MTMRPQPLSMIRGAIQQCMRKNIYTAPVHFTKTTYDKLQQCIVKQPMFRSPQLYQVTMLNTSSTKFSDYDTDATEEKSEIISTLAQTLSATQCNSQTLNEMCDIFLNAKVKKEDLIKLLGDNPEILEYKTKLIESQVNFFRDNGFKPEEVAQLIYGYPGSLEFNQNGMMESFAILRDIGFNEGKIHTVFVKHPVLLKTKPSQIMQRFNDLMAIFRKSDIMRLISFHPNVLTDSWSSIEDRINYVVHEMGLDQSHIMHSNLFGYSLQHLTERHVFLLRAGLYEMPNKHGVTKIENPTLARILRTSDDIFARKIAGMSEEEFLVFKRMFALEMEEEEGGEALVKRQEGSEYEEESEDEDSYNYEKRKKHRKHDK